MNKPGLAVAAALCILYLVSCGKTPDGNIPEIPEGEPTPASSAGDSSQDVPKGSSPVGVWYEQAENADRLDITENVVKYSSGTGSYTYEMPYRLRKEGEKTRLETDDFFIYEDMYYEKEEDILVCYTMSHTDGDGGHHRVEFRRTEYTAPPKPTYPPPVDRSDPDAQKVFDDLTIRSMEASFYDEGEPYDIDSSMAMQPPFADNYSYSLTVQEDGSALVSSSFCREIDISKETVDELQRLISEADLGQINGIDIHTEGLPYDAPDYEAEFRLASGETIRSSANGDNVPEIWTSFQKQMHYLLFFEFVDAGYNYSSGEFHSTKPMKRIGGPDRLRRESSGFSCENVIIKPDWKKTYDYTLDTKYFVFREESGNHPALVKTLNALSEQYKKTAEAELKKDYEMMEAVPKSVRKKADRKYCYSLYAVDNWSLSGNIFSFTVSEGHANSLGAGDNGYGRYRSIRYNIDVDTGRILSVSDLFDDTDSVYDSLMEIFSRYGTHNDSGKFVHSGAFPSFLRKALESPEPDGIGFNFYYDYLELWMPLGMYEGNDSQLREILYYDEIQDILGEDYTEIY